MCRVLFKLTKFVPRSFLLALSASCRIVENKEKASRPGALRDPGPSRTSGCARRRLGRDPFNQNSNRSDREKWSTSKGGPVFSKLFRLDRTDPLSFGSKFPEILVEWIAPLEFTAINQSQTRDTMRMRS